MTILIDRPRFLAHGRRWSHLVSDESIDELHAFAAALGVPRRGFEGDHYDLPEEYFDAAGAAGAEMVSSGELIRRLNASGLRMRKRKGDKGISRATVAIPGWPAMEVDSILSRRAAPEESVFGAVTFVLDAVADFVLVYSVKRRQWGSPGGWREVGETPGQAAVREITEECGLEIAPTMLAPRGFHRFQRHDDEPNVLQIYEARLGETRPSLTVGFDDVDRARWATFTEMRDLCADAFWWPVAAWLYDPDGPLLNP